LPEQHLAASLLKTINRRLQKLEYLRNRFNEQINSFDEVGAKPVKRDDHLLVKIGAKIKLIQFNEIVCIKALKEYCTVITKDNCKIVIRKSMNNWEKVLPANAFLRIHRATIINLSYVETIKKTGIRTYSVKLKQLPETFDLSYRYANIMRKTFPS
jgi:DNA-binding LytR/AlgR family response regulator